MPPKISTEPPLIFDWEKARSRFGKLLLALILVVVGLVLFFNVFRVVYPQSERFTPVPHQVLALDVTRPEGLAIMNKVRDVDFMILPERGSQAEGPSLQELAPLFHPSFEGHELTLQDLPHRPFTAPSPRLLDANEPVLPELGLSELKDKVGSVGGGGQRRQVASRLLMKFRGLGEERLPRTTPHLGEVPAFDTALCRFRIGVGADGRVTFALPVNASEAENVARFLMERVSRLQFAPLVGGAEGDVGVQWGEVYFEWE